MTLECPAIHSWWEKLQPFRPFPVVSLTGRWDQSDRGPSLSQGPFRGSATPQPSGASSDAQS